MNRRRIYVNSLSKQLEVLLTLTQCPHPKVVMDSTDAIAQPHFDAEWKPKTNPWVIALTVTIATFMEVLDASIANVALPHIGGVFRCDTE